MTSAIALRAARATDADSAVPLIYSSGPAAFDFVFSHPRRGQPLDFLRYAFIDGRGEFGYRNHSVVELDGSVVGVGAGYSGATALPFTLAAARQIVGRYGILAGPAIILRGLRVERVVPPPLARDLFYIGHLGIAPNLRGRGIGRQLTDYLLQQGRARGFKRVALDVSTANPRAQALYERIGFRVTADNHSTLRNRYAIVPAHRRMEMAL
jgi:ribosomal protein S18 acetylase RimI-like enzyme